MTTRLRRTSWSGRGFAPALVAVTTTAGAVRAATAPTVPSTAPPNVAVTASCGPVVGSVCTGYGGLDLGVLAAFGGGRLAWCADPDPRIRQILAAQLPGVPNLGGLAALGARYRGGGHSDAQAKRACPRVTGGRSSRCSGCPGATRSAVWTNSG